MRTRETEQLRYKGIRPAAIAADLDCSHEHVLNLIRAGKLHGVDIGAGKSPEYRVSEASYKAFLDSQAVRPAAA